MLTNKVYTSLITRSDNASKAAVMCNLKSNFVSNPFSKPSHVDSLNTQRPEVIRNKTLALITNGRLGR